MNQINKRPEGADNDEAKGAIATRNQQDAQVKATMSTLVEKYSKELVGDKRAAQFAAQLVLLKQQMPKLASCSNDSILASMMACVHLDLMPNTPEGYAYIIPYGSTATFQVGYQGLQQLAYRSGQIRKIDAQLVFPGDDFDYAMGTESYIKHKIDMATDRTNVKEAVCTYAVATLSNGETVFRIVTNSEIDKIEKTVKSSKEDTPWKQWKEQQMKKTAIKQLLKYLPKSADDNRLAYAATYDSLSEVGKLKFDKDTGQIIEGEVVNDTNPFVDSGDKEIKNYASAELKTTKNTKNNVPRPNKNTEGSSDKPEESTKPSDGNINEKAGSDDSDAVPVSEGVQSTSEVSESTTADDEPEINESKQGATKTEGPTLDTRSDEKIRKDIQDLIDYLELDKREQTRVFNKHGRKLLLHRIERRDLFKVEEALAIMVQEREPDDE